MVNSEKILLEAGMLPEGIFSSIKNFFSSSPNKKQVEALWKSQDALRSISNLLRRIDAPVKRINYIESLISTLDRQIDNLIDDINDVKDPYYGRRKHRRLSMSDYDV